MVRICRFLLVLVLVASLVVHTECRRSEAAVPVAIGMIVLILSAVATGSAIGWMSYNANGKEVYVKLKGALKDGVQVTRDWVQRQIAELHGIDTAPSARVYTLADVQAGRLPTVGDYIYWGQGTYEIMELSGVSCCSSSVEYTIGNVGGTRTLTVRLGYDWGNNGQVFRYPLKFISNSIVPPSNTFNPADYPELYTGPALENNCHEVAKRHPDLVPLYEISDVKPEGFDESNATVQEIGGYTNGYVIDQYGNKLDVNSFLRNGEGVITVENGTVYNAADYVESGNYIQAANGTKVYLSDILSSSEAKITAANGTVYSASGFTSGLAVNGQFQKIYVPGSVLEKLENATSKIDPMSYSNAAIAVPTTDDEKKKGAPPPMIPLPSWLGGRLKGSGIDIEGSTIDSIAPGRVNWTDSKGISHTTLVDTALSKALAEVGAGQLVTVDGVTSLLPASVAAATAAAQSYGPDPGNPPDIPLPDVPMFDPEMDWGEEEPWPWESWISSLPFIDVLKSSSVVLSGSTSSISCDITLLGRSRTISYDFSEWDWLLNSMGILIYACACWYALQLALLKRD